MTKDPKRYDIENIPVSKETERVLGESGIYVLGALGRMLSTQDDVYEEEFNSIKKSLERIEKSLRRKCLNHERRLVEIEAKLAS
jgi:glutathionyl-hydroquinone reductase